MITEQKIDDTIVRLSKLSEEEYISEYMSEMKKQTHISNFLSESADHFMIEKDSENSLLELCFQILNIYKDNFKKEYSVITSETIINTLKKRKNLQEKQAEILGVNLSENNSEEIEKKYELVQKDIEQNPEKTDNKYKELFEINDEINKMQYQKNLFNYCTYFIENDKYTIEKDKPAIKSIIDVLLKSLEIQINGDNKQ